VKVGITRPMKLSLRGSSLRTAILIYMLVQALQLEDAQPREAKVEVLLGRKASFEKQIDLALRENEKSTNGIRITNLKLQP
jgi:hypothetical protein